MLLAGTNDARGFRQWQEVGISVSRGEQGVPHTRTRQEEDKEKASDEHGEPGEEFSDILVGFKSIPVFRFEDTEGAGICPSTSPRPLLHSWRSPKGSVSRSSTSDSPPVSTEPPTTPTRPSCSPPRTLMSSSTSWVTQSTAVSSRRAATGKSQRPRR